MRHKVTRIRGRYSWSGEARDVILGWNGETLGSYDGSTCGPKPGPSDASRLHPSRGRSPIPRTRPGKCFDAASGLAPGCQQVVDCRLRLLHCGLALLRPSDTSRAIVFADNTEQCFLAVPWIKTGTSDHVGSGSTLKVFPFAPEKLGKAPKEQRGVYAAGGRERGAQFFRPELPGPLQKGSNCREPLLEALEGFRVLAVERRHEGRERLPHAAPHLGGLRV